MKTVVDTISSNCFRNHFGKKHNLYWLKMMFKEEWFF